MALSDILQVIASKKDAQILHMCEEFVAVEKNLLEEAEKKELSIRPKDFEILKHQSLRKKKNTMQILHVLKESHYLTFKTL